MDETVRIAPRDLRADSHAGCGIQAPVAFRPHEAVPGFDLLEELGRGGMGVVYKARQHGLNRVVALKMLVATARSDESGRLRFFTEAEAVAAIQHPNVVQVYEFGDADGRPYMAMEFVDGGSLARLLAERKTLPVAAAARLVEQTARGVQAAHDAGIVHRDIKPANVLLAGMPDGHAPASEAGAASDANSGSRAQEFQPKVGDFGIAKRGGAADLTQTGVAMGTPAYMSPEQARGRTKFVGPGADVYALGVILYECLTGQLPFAAGDTIELLHKVAFHDPPPLRAFAPGVAADLELICLKCLQKSPHERYPTAAALADDLARFLVGEPVSVRPPGRAERAAMWVRRSPLRAALYG
jgi:serine/threonine protein kinase